MTSHIHYWNYPTEIYAGEDALGLLPSVCKQQHLRHLFLVSDQGLGKLGISARAKALLEAADIQVTLFEDVQSNPTTDNVYAGVAAFQAGRFDGVVALGGGSVIDAAKAIALVSRQATALSDFDWNVAFEKYPSLGSFPRLGVPPLIIIPTTAGTGSELSREAVITHSAEQTKHVVTHAELLARVVLLDPALTTGLPAHLTAATGLDALTHHIEALVSPLYHPMSAGIALEGIRLISQFLPLAVKEPDNMAARTQMLVASAMAAVAFQKGLGGVHAIAHALGARYHKHHGLLNAILLPYLLKANAAAIEEPLRLVARVVGLPGERVDDVIDWVVQLRQALGIPHTLAEIGMTGEESDLIGAAAVADLSSADTNPIALTADDYARIFLNAVHGRLTES
ncbi:iron-containing alcohol dehydrogenase [Leeia oryzae]|uniref:iron-containing alcohol dehydrogenase n=1 Tax=Leeia oryzae TaxID=356662 RepID=UPI000476A6F1|nr:iron-containing alcohol dehydrogenase [Leeia oryzae]